MHETLTNMLKDYCKVIKIYGIDNPFLFPRQLPYFLHIILNIQNALKSDTEMNITYKDYLKRRFKFSALEPFPVFTRFYSTIHSIIKNRNKKRIYFGFFMSPTHLR